MGCKGVAHEQASAMQPTFDRGQGQAKHLADVAIGQALDIGQHVNVAIKLRQVAD